jgi:hypothetical protein
MSKKNRVISFSMRSLSPCFAWKKRLPGFARLRLASPRSLRFASSLRFLASLASSGSYALSVLMSRLWLFAVSKQESLLYGKKKGLYWVIVSIGTKEVIKWKTYRQ